MPPSEKLSMRLYPKEGNAAAACAMYVLWGLRFSLQYFGTGYGCHAETTVTRTSKALAVCCRTENSVKEYPQRHCRIHQGTSMYVETTEARK